MLDELLEGNFGPFWSYCRGLRTFSYKINVFTAATLGRAEYSTVLKPVIFDIENLTKNRGPTTIHVSIPNGGKLKILSEIPIQENLQ